MGLNRSYGNAGGAQTDLTPMINPWIDPALGNVSGNTRLEGLLMPKDQNYVAKTRSLMYDVKDVNISQTKRYSAYNSAYIEGIHNLYEFDCGQLSGWIYKVNGWSPNYGCSRYDLADGDVIEWQYTCNLGIDIDAYYAVGG